MITQYTFEDADGQELTYTTFDCVEAKSHAESFGLLCIANEYEFSDRDVAWDCRESDVNEDDLSSGDKLIVEMEGPEGLL